ncbi:DUF4435 domain-containing protein [uncultured Chryseobacterium sp.]|uniref:DUF4435 domain-containing protein n=1 Tax=uncultured Chryseobacterium sp. TaxID=259322 RepID=UPI0025DF21AE|nr:DUF4435 domain-containing protein [uncultured Chryseobacterium sp.]
MGLEITVDEIIETLKRSSLTTVLVEGVDDVMIYRWLEDEIGIHKASFLPCGGRENLLKIYERRAEFSNLTTVFVADKDSYVYINPPKKYSDIIWTNGYSIENDLYYGRNIERLFSKDEKEVFTKSLNNFIEYYAFEVENYLNQKEFSFRNHPQHILCDVQHIVKQDFLKKINFVKPDSEIENKLKASYDILIRGKSLFALVTRILSNKNRQIKHSKVSLLEHCYRTHKSEMFNRLLIEIEKRISA